VHAGRRHWTTRPRFRSNSPCLNRNLGLRHLSVLHIASVARLMDGHSIRSTCRKYWPGGRCLQGRPVQNPVVPIAAVGGIRHRLLFRSGVLHLSRRRIASSVAALPPQWRQKFWQYKRYRLGAVPLGTNQFRLSLSTRLCSILCRFLHTLYTGGCEDLDTGFDDSRHVSGRPTPRRLLSIVVLGLRRFRNRASVSASFASGATTSADTDAWKGVR